MNNDIFNSNYGLGIGLQITRLENMLEEFIMKIFVNISRFFVNNFLENFRKIVIHFNSAKNLGFYSKSLILASILLYIFRILRAYLKSAKRSIFNKKISSLMFLKSISNKKFSFNEEKTLNIAKLNINHEKIKNYIKIHKAKMKKLSIETKETVEDPYYKLMKFYLEYSDPNYNNLNKIIP